MNRRFWDRRPAFFETGLFAAAGALIALMTFSGCGQGTGPAKRDEHVEIVTKEAVQNAKKISFSELEVPPKPKTDPAQLIAKGKQVYEQNCAVCHGVKGEGNGEAAPFLVPRPRNFVLAQYRLRTTATGNLPTDQDLFRSVSLGMPGTPMPPWRFHLSDDDRWAVVEYIKTFSPQFQQSESQPQVIAISDPPPKSETAVKQGHELFEKYACNTCHGDRGKGDGPSAGTLVNDVGQKITPRNLTNPAAYKSGYSEKDIVRTVLTGFNGTPMLGFAGAMKPEEAWDIAYFIQTLAKPGPNVILQASRSGLAIADPGPADVKVRLIERAWHYVPDTIRIKQGEVIEITFEPTDNGLGAGHGFAVSGYDEEAFLNGAMVGAPKKVKFKANRAGQFTYYCATQCSTDKLHPLMNGTLIVEENEPMKTASIK